MRFPLIPSAGLLACDLREEGREAQKDANRIEREIPESDYEILREPGFDAPARQAKPTTCHRPTPDLAAYGHD